MLFLNFSEFSEFSKAATEEQEQPFFTISQEGLDLFVEQTFYRRVYNYYVLRAETKFPGGFIEQTYFFQGVSICSRTDLLISHKLLFSPRTHTNLSGIFSSNRYQFSRSLHFLIEQIFILQEALSSPRTHIIFQETPMPRTDRNFQGRPRLNRYFVNGLGGCFRLVNHPSPIIKKGQYQIKSILF